MSQNEWKTTEIRASKAGNFSPFSCPGDAVSPPDPAVVRSAVDLLCRLGALGDDRASLSPLGLQLARLHVHPVLGKLLLLGDLFDCRETCVTVAAGLGSKSPFLCPLGKEGLANAAKARLADGTDSDHVLLARAYDTWVASPTYRDKRRFCDDFFLSHQTLDYIHQLRRDLRDGAREVLQGDALNHHQQRRGGGGGDARLATALLSALWPNVAAVRKMGKGLTLETGLKVVCHPGSVNKSAADRLVVFYDIQETSDRYLYDTSVVSLAMVVLFAPTVALSRTNSGKAKLDVARDLHVLVDPDVLDDVVETRRLLAAFVQQRVGKRNDPKAAAAADALAALFGDDVRANFGDDDDDDDAANLPPPPPPRAAPYPRRGEAGHHRGGPDTRAPPYRAPRRGRGDGAW